MKAPEIFKVNGVSSNIKWEIYLPQGAFLAAAAGNCNS